MWPAYRRRNSSELTRAAPDRPAWHCLAQADTGQGSGTYGLPCGARRPFPRLPRMPHVGGMPTDHHIAAGLLGRVEYGRVAASVRALPFLAPARHIVEDDRVLLRMHKGHGHHRVCEGSVVAYGADNLESAPAGVETWSVQVVGVCEPVEPTAAQLERFGPGPLRVDGHPFEPVYLGIAPRLTTVHSMGVTPGAST